jgi:hypothetical protein
MRLLAGSLVLGALAATGSTAVAAPGAVPASPPAAYAPTPSSQPSVPPSVPPAVPSDEEAAWGELDPGKGFLVGQGPIGELRISVYALGRYINQLPGVQTFVDHLGNVVNVDPRNDFQLHRVLVYLNGWVYLPKFAYSVVLWTVNATTQVAIVGVLSYRLAKQFIPSIGIGGLPGTRSMLNSHPYFLAFDRVMADEFFRPGFTSGVWATGEAVPRLFYKVMVGNNLSQLGITARQLTRDLAYSGSIWWQPTTGEFGPRGGFGDYEWHEDVATRFGVSYTHSREDRLSDLAQKSPDNTQIRLSDSVLLFQTGALANGVTVQKANYDLLAADAGLKTHGFFLQTEVYFRWLSNFLADGPLPLKTVVDRGFYVQAAQMVLPSRLEAYGVTSVIFGQFNDSWEAGGGLNYYPDDSRNLKLNLQTLYVNRTAASSLFGYYTGGQTGITVSSSLGVFF